jgi:hypothetical protein
MLSNCQDCAAARNIGPGCGRRRRRVTDWQTIDDVDTPMAPADIAAKVSYL